MVKKRAVCGYCKVLNPENPSEEARKRRNYLEARLKQDFLCSFKPRLTVS